jgi:hypothetical protein
VIGLSPAELRSLTMPACIIPGNDRVHPRRAITLEKREVSEGGSLGSAMKERPPVRNDCLRRDLSRSPVGLPPRADPGAGIKRSRDR